MDHLEHNLAVLARRQPELAGILKATPLRHIQLTSARNGLPTGFYRRPEAGSVPLHSRYDPLQEARQSLKEINLKEADYFIFLGFGLGYGLDALLESTARERVHVFVVESDPEVLRAAFAARDLTALLSLPFIHFAWPTAGNELAQQWQNFFDPVQAQMSVFVSHPPSLVLDPPLYKSAAEIINSRTLQIFTDINTMIGSSQVFLANFVANLPRASSLPGVKAFAQQFAGVTCVLVSAGPSLDRNIHELRSVHNRALVLAADTALKPLLAAGVEPHFVMTADPRHENYLHLKDAITRDTYLVGEATAYPDSLASFDGRTILCTFENSSLPTLANLLASKGSLRAWGSVATMCLDFALMLGCNPIIFLGQDLAFSEGRTYCTGLHWEQEWFCDVRGPEDWQRRWAEIRAANQIVMTRDLFGRPVASTDKLVSYWNWITAEIEKHRDVNFINATEGGILRDHVQIMSLREALYRFCGEERDLRAEIRSRYAEAIEQNPALDLSVLTRIKEEDRQLQGIIRQGLDLCRPENLHLPVRELAARCERVKQSVHSLTHLAPLLDCFNQMGAFSFLRRQAAQSGAKVSNREIQESYLEYFQSISTASKTIEDGLSRLKPM